MKRLFPLLLLLAAALPGKAVTHQIRDIFKEMPDSLIPYLTQNNRLDFIDFMDSHMKAEVKNAFEGTSEMTALTTDSLSLTLSEALRIDMLLLPLENQVDSQVVCMVRTYSLGDQRMERVVDFYTTEWQRLENSPMLPEAQQQRIKPFEMQTIFKWEDEILNKN